MPDGDVFGDDGKPRRMTKTELLDQIDLLRALILADDSMEGALLYEWADDPGYYNVGGIMRMGNSMGQGGARILWETG